MARQIFLIRVNGQRNKYFGVSRVTAHDHFVVFLQHICSAQQRNVPVPTCETLAAVLRIAYLGDVCLSCFKPTAIGR